MVVDWRSACVERTEEVVGIDGFVLRTLRSIGKCHVMGGWAIFILIVIFMVDPEFIGRRMARIDELPEANNRYLEETRSVRSLLKSYMAAAPRVLGFFRHLKRGSTYGLVLEAEAQCATRPIEEGDRIAVYTGTDGRRWVRRMGEFEDGRYDRVEPEAASPH